MVEQTNSATSPRKSYLRALGLDRIGAKKAKLAALERAHSIREFEIELSWKRATYFWLLQAAVFTALGLTWRNQLNATSQSPLPLALAGLGILTAWAAWLANQGSKFWQRNWEHHIDMLEGEFEGDLYKNVFVNHAGKRWSVTGVSDGLIVCFLAFWVLTLVYLSFELNPNWLVAKCCGKPDSHEALTLTIWALTGVAAYFLWTRTSGIKGVPFPYTNFDEGERLPSPTFRPKRDGQRMLVRREPDIR